MAKRTVAFIIVLLLTFACHYSFTGSSVPPHLHTIAIPLAKDNSGSGEPTLRDDFTNGLIQKFIDDNSLQVTDKSNADALLECTIVSLHDAPTVVSGGEEITKRRITVSVRVVYRDMVKRKTVFSKTFSNFADYNTDGDITSLRNDAIAVALDKLTDDILLAVVSNW